MLDRALRVLLIIFVCEWYQGVAAISSAGEMKTHAGSGSYSSTDGTATPAPRWLTTATVFTAGALSGAIEEDAYIVLGQSITLDPLCGSFDLSTVTCEESAFSISGVTGLTIDGGGYYVGFQGRRFTMAEYFRLVRRLR